MPEKKQEMVEARPVFDQCSTSICPVFDQCLLCERERERSPGERAGQAEAAVRLGYRGVT